MLSDNMLKQRVLDELRWDTRFDAAKIGVVASGGAITLTGHVQSYPEKYSAIEATKSVKGVKAVADDIDVVLPDEKRSDDGDVAERISHVLSWNTSIPKDSVKAVVKAGFVTLTGELNWQNQRKHIEQQIRHIIGVCGISNCIQLNEIIASADVKKQIEDALQRNAKLEAEHVKVSVSGHTVVLDGKVKAYYERELIERAAWAAPGVREVVDDIRVV